MNKTYKNDVVNLALDTLRLNKQALVFVNTKSSAEKEAEEIAKKCSLSPECEELADRIRKTLPQPTKQCIRLSACIRKGIAFHHAGLHAKQKERIEEAFREGVIKIICSTPTLAAGLDLPAFRAIIRDTKRYGNYGMTDIPVLEYLQMVGRAGRPKYDLWGEGICIAKREEESGHLLETYVCGTPENIYSKLAVEPVFRTYVLSLVAADFVRTKDEIMRFFSRTFWAHQYKDLKKIEKDILGMLEQLREWGFLEKARGDFVSGNALNRENYRATPTGKRVAELYLDPLTAHQFLKALEKAGTTKTKDVSYLQLACSSLEMRPYVRVRQKDWEWLNDEAVGIQPHLLQDEPSIYDIEYEMWFDALKTSLMMKAWIEEKDDIHIMEQFGVRPGETRAKLKRMEWLMYALDELARVAGKHGLRKEIREVRIRLKHGVKSELLPLVRIKGIGRARARTLFRNNIKSAGDINNASLQTLEQILGPRLARSIKGNAEEPISRFKRQGQMGLGKYVG